MSNAEELLASLTEKVPVHEHTVTDSDTYFIIDPVTRRLENTARKKNVLMQFDHESEVFTFEIPRYVEGHDMMLCNKVYAHWNNIGTKTGNEEETLEETADLHQLTDLQVNPDDPDTVICTWAPTRQSTQLIGILSFLIQYACVDEDGNVTYEWHTDFYEDMEIRKGRKNSPGAVSPYSDILEQWYAKLFGISDSIVHDISLTLSAAQQTLQEESASQQSAIEAKGQETLDSIPPEYTELYRMSEEAMRTKADAIVVSVEGTDISVTNASNDPLMNLRMFGKTTQAGEPSPDNQQELVSIENPNVMVRGKNLIPETNIEFTRDLYMPLGFKYPTGRYTFSAVLTSTDTDDVQSAVMFYDGSEWVDSVFVTRSENGERISYSKLVENDFDTIRFYAGRSYNLSEGDECKITDMQLEVGRESTEFEPYMGRILPIQRTVQGIPVDKDGNYTDANGQEWIADEVVYNYPSNKWQYVQRVFCHTYDGTESWIQHEITDDDRYVAYCGLRVPMVTKIARSLCDRFVYSAKLDVGTFLIHIENSGSGTVHLSIPTSDLTEVSVSAFKTWLSQHPTTVCAAMSEPIIHDLTTEEVLAFKALRTNKPNTVIQNGVGAYMIAEYNADTELYIRENQFRPTDEQMHNAIDSYFTKNNITIPSDDHIRALIDEVLGGIVNGEY